MKFLLLFFLTILFSGCMFDEKEKSHFEDLMGKEDVVLVLSNYPPDSIPKVFALLGSAKSLSVVSDSAFLTSHTLYPPLSALGTSYVSGEPSLKFLPKEITTLKKLQRLSLVGLGIEKLPEDFSNLENLEALDLTFNELEISEELDKLKRLPKLKEIGLFGNKVDSLDIQKWQKEKPSLRLDYQVTIEL
ncbi:acyl-CoA synthetase family protein [Rufibacter hautae]|uniref:Leucine-rich repeat domain-containing protein n=1 Tax=Rufibacter hautae TaxID=2595005 RepID=A0A5B6TMM3_9BACT|nr:hypothetical protein [Rufibacter hautae]KAA3437563.1 hypothetical protein FOA19_09610 [Rufibacter hautae]